MLCCPDLEVEGAKNASFAPEPRGHTAAAFSRFETRQIAEAKTKEGPAQLGQSTDLSFGTVSAPQSLLGQQGN